MAGRSPGGYRAIGRACRVIAESLGKRVAARGRRKRAGVDIDYYEFDFRLKSVLREVIRGPKCSRSVDEVRSALFRAGYANIEVKDSGLTYR
jgi:hypothetical protein